MGTGEKHREYSRCFECGFSFSFSFSITITTTIYFTIMINSTIDDINLEERLEEGPDKLPATLESYQIYLRKFAKFVKTAGKYKINGPMIVKEFFKDEIIANISFILEIITINPMS
jgi:hypothetical protein